MHPLLNKISETGKFINSKNEVVPVHSETSLQQCAFLQGIINSNKFKSSIEIGMAYGTSSLAIAEAISEHGGECVVIDPYENSYWGGNGLDLIAQAGYEAQVEFIEQCSYIALPNFLEEGRRFDFAYIDSTKLIDWLMVDFFFLDKLLEVNGIIVFDDVSFPAIRKLLRYLSQLPYYEVCGQFPANRRLSSIRKILLKPFIPPFVLKEELRVTDYRLGVNTQCVALRKTGYDERNYDWHVPF